MLVEHLRMQSDLATKSYVEQQVQSAIDAIPKVVPQADKASKDGNGRDISGTYTPKDGTGAYGTWNVNVTGRVASAGTADNAARAPSADRAGWADGMNLALNIPIYDRGGNIWIA